MEPTKSLAEWLAPDHGSIEARNAEWFDPMYYKIPDYRLYRVDNMWTRFYYDPEIRRLYPSVTSVLGAELAGETHLTNWKIRMALEHGYLSAADDYTDERAHLGTLYHTLCTRGLVEGQIDFDAVEDAIKMYWELHFIRYDLSDWSREVRAKLASFARFIYDHNVRPIAVEAVLKSDKMGVAGALDLSAEIDARIVPGGGYELCAEKTPMDKRVRVRVIIDYKTSKAFQEKHIIQVGMYQKMYNENFPDRPASMALLFRPTTSSTKAGSYELKMVDHSPKHEKLPHLLKLFELDGHLNLEKEHRIVGKLALGQPIEHSLRQIDAIQRVEDFINNSKQ